MLDVRGRDWLGRSSGTDCGGSCFGAALRCCLVSESFRTCMSA